MKAPTRIRPDTVAMTSGWFTKTSACHTVSVLLHWSSTHTGTRAGSGLSATCHIGSSPVTPGAGT
ncbi:hypothetical protein ACFQ9X_47875 [Catenulispora yoronensis]